MDIDVVENEYKEREPWYETVDIFPEKLTTDQNYIISRPHRSFFSGRQKNAPWVFSDLFISLLIACDIFSD